MCAGWLQLRGLLLVFFSKYLPTGGPFIIMLTRKYEEKEIFSIKYELINELLFTIL